MRFFAVCVIVNKTAKKGGTGLKKKQLTEEEKQARKENIQGWIFMLLFLVAFIVAFAVYGMQSSLFGGG